MQGRPIGGRLALCAAKSTGATPSTPPPLLCVPSAPSRLLQKEMPTLPLSRTSLASLRCSSTPFLGSRLVRTPAYAAFLPARCATPLTGLQRAPYAKEARARPKNADKRRPDYDARRTTKRNAAVAGDAPVLAALEAACDKVDVRTLLELYPGLVATKALERDHTRRIAKALHTRVRNMSRADVSVHDLLIFVQRIVTDIQEGALAPHPWAHVHLLGFYKECGKYQEGYQFWQWLVEGDHMHVSQAVYGAALELMAYGNIVPLHEMENIYADCLKRYPGTFAEYHLSPDAIVPDRSQPVALADLPMSLLQGILTARILAGDWRKAYLALDTALRLFPAQVPTRFFELFITERPPPEAYTAFLVACRAGVLLKPGHLTSLIKQVRSTLSSASLRERITSLRAIANAIYAYVEAGGSLHGPKNAPILGSFIRAFDVVISRPVEGENPSDEQAKIRVMMVTAAHEFASTMIQAGLPPQISVFNALIQLAGKNQVPSLLQACLNDIETAQLELSPADFRTIIDAAGWLGDKEMLERFWNRIVSDAETRGEQLDYSDWITFVKACTRGGQSEYFKEQLWKHDHTLPAALKLKLTFLSQQVLKRDKSVDLNMGLEALSAEIETLRGQVKNIAAVIMSGQPLDLRKSPFYMSLDPTRPSLGSPQDLRTIYDELTTDPHQPASPSGTITPALSPTSIPLDDLRFQNWVSVLEMMSHAKLHATAEKANAPFGGFVPDGLPLELDTLRETIRNLRGLTLVSYQHKSQRNFDDHSYRIRRISLDQRHPIGTSPSSADSAAIKSADSPVRRSYQGEGLDRPPRLNYYIALKNEHEAPAPAALKISKHVSKNWKLGRNTLGIQREKTNDSQSKLQGEMQGANSSTS
jgi:hypothetical protein